MMSFEKKVADGWYEAACIYCGDALLYSIGEWVTTQCAYSEEFDGPILGVVCETCWKRVEQDVHPDCFMPLIHLVGEGLE